MKEINQKILLERFLNMEAALNMLAKEVQLAKMELTREPKITQARMRDNAIEQMVTRNREKAQLRREKRFAAKNDLGKL